MLLITKEMRSESGNVIENKEDDRSLKASVARTCALSGARLFTDQTHMPQSLP